MPAKSATVLVAAFGLQGLSVASRKSDSAVVVGADGRLGHFQGKALERDSAEHVVGADSHLEGKGMAAVLAEVSGRGGEDTAGSAAEELKCCQFYKTDENGERILNSKGKPKAISLNGFGTKDQCKITSDQECIDYPNGPAASEKLTLANTSPPTACKAKAPMCASVTDLEESTWRATKRKNVMGLCMCEGYKFFLRGYYWEDGCPDASALCPKEAEHQCCKFKHAFNSQDTECRAGTGQTCSVGGFQGMMPCSGDPPPCSAYLAHATIMRHGSGRSGRATKTA